MRVNLYGPHPTNPARRVCTIGVADDDSSAQRAANNAWFDYHASLLFTDTLAPERRHTLTLEYPVPGVPTPRATTVGVRYDLEYMRPLVEAAIGRNSPTHDELQVVEVAEFTLMRVNLYGAHPLESSPADLRRRDRRPALQRCRRGRAGVVQVPRLAAVQRAGPERAVEVTFTLRPGQRVEFVRGWRSATSSIGTTSTRCSGRCSGAATRSSDRPSATGRSSTTRSSCTADLPIGWTDEQDGGRYRLARRDDEALFGYAVGPHSWKKYQLPADVKLWRRAGRARRRAQRGHGGAARIAAVRVPRRALVRAARDGDPRPGAARRSPPRSGRPRAHRRLFVVAVQCGEAGGTCFCVSMDTGPVADRGFDLALTEILDDGRHHFVVEVGSERGGEVLADVPHREATDSDRTTAAHDARAHRLADGPRARHGRHQGAAVPQLRPSRAGTRSPIAA